MPDDDTENTVEQDAFLSLGRSGEKTEEQQPDVDVIDRQRFFHPLSGEEFRDFGGGDFPQAEKAPILLLTREKNFSSYLN